MLSADGGKVGVYHRPSNGHSGPLEGDVAGLLHEASSDPDQLGVQASQRLGGHRSEHIDAAQEVGHITR